MKFVDRFPQPVGIGTVVGILAALLLAPLVLGCEEEVTAIIGTDHPFELYGVLDPTADTQFVRVFPIAGRLEQSTSTHIDAIVTSTDFETGDDVAWTDSVIAFADGTFGHLFWTPIRVGGGRSYRVQAWRSDGAFSQAYVVVPHVPELLPVEQSSIVSVPVQFGAPDVGIRSVEVEYLVEHGWCAGEQEYFRLPYTEKIRSTGTLQRIDLELSVDRFTMRESLLFRARYNWTVGVLARHIILRVSVGEAAWLPPRGIFDPEVLIEPGVFSNVENGFGFVGGGYSLELLLLQLGDRPPDWSPLISPETLEAAGFTIEMPTPPQMPWICVPFGP